MTRLSDVNPRIATFTGCFIGFVLIGDLTVAEQNSIGNFLELVGQVLLANAAQQSVIESRAQNGSINTNSCEFKSIYDPLFYDIEKLREIIKNFTQDTSSMDTIINSLEKMKEELEKLKKN